LEAADICFQQQITSRKKGHVADHEGVVFNHTNSTTAELADPRLSTLKPPSFADQRRDPQKIRAYAVDFFFLLGKRSKSFWGSSPLAAVSHSPVFWLSAHVRTVIGNQWHDSAVK
jgi:hypothetical protein